MNVKNVVKVMNFHSLLKVDKARRDAENFFGVENELREMIASIYNNRNYRLDKKTIQIRDDMPTLNIYIGSDLGFCAGYNYNVNTAAKKDGSDKVIIGKKLWKSISNVKLQINKNDYLENRFEVSDFLTDAVLNGKYSEINVFYNQYINTSNITFNCKRLFPFSFDDDEFKALSYNEDFISETDIEYLLKSMIATYIDYEILIIIKNSLASENIMRQNSTNDSLKKIDELEEAKKYELYKKKMAKTSEKTIESFVKLKSQEKA